MNGINAINAMRQVNLGCHGIPSRCLTLRGHRMKICARCFGCNIGHVTALFLFIFGLMPSGVVAFMLLAPLLLDVTVQEKFGRESTNSRRLATGVLGGLGFGLIIYQSATWVAHSLGVS